MTNQLSITLRNARVNSIESTIGASAILQFRAGAQPADCAAADTGTLLCSITLPADWLTAAAAGAVSKAGTWSGVCVAGGVVGHYRIKDSTGVTTHMQGSCGQGSGDMSFTDTNLEINETVTVSAATITSGNP